MCLQAVMATCWTLSIRFPLRIRCRTRPFFDDDSSNAVQSTTKYYTKHYTKYYKVLQSTTSYYCVLLRPTKYNKLLLRTRQSTTPVILRTAKYCSVLERTAQVLQRSTSTTARGGGGSFKNKKPIGEIGCCEPEKAQHWWFELSSLIDELTNWLID